MVISNSEAAEYQKCVRSHYYHYGLGIEPKLMNIGLDRGITGHKALEIYHKAILAGASITEAKIEAVTFLANRSAEYAGTFMPEDQDSARRMRMYTELIKIVDRYVDYYEFQPLEIVEVETTHIVKLNDRISYGFRPDLIAIWKAPPYRGDLIVVDWKFRFNFMNPAAIKMNAQIPKYVKGLKSEGHVVSKGMLDFIRYRSLKDPQSSDMFRRDMVAKKPSVLEKIMEDQLAISEEIYIKKQLPVKEYGATARRTMNELTCKNCPFADICNTELNGQDITRALTANFKTSEYGYEVDDEELAA